MIFFPPFLGGTLFSSNSARLAAFPFLAFCAASSSTYIVNDIYDREKDALHPDKKIRPIASGRISLRNAIILSVILFILGLYSACNVSLLFASLLILYVAISIAYSHYFKQIALVDIFFISFGFLLRLQAGGVAFDIPISEWLFLSVFLLSVFLSSGKRLSEIMRLGGAAHNHRKALTSYPRGFLEGSMYMTGGTVLVTYAMYVISRHSPVLLYSVPLCCFGLMRYILRVQAGMGGDPTESLLRDIPLLLVGLTWSLIVGWGIYG